MLFIPLLLTVAIKSTTSSGLVNNVYCYDTHAEVILSRSYFAGTSFINRSGMQIGVIGHYVNDTYASCSQPIIRSSEYTKLNFSYTGCNAEIFNVITADGIVHSGAVLNLRLRSVVHAARLSQRLRVNCHYRMGRTNTWATGTINEVGKTYGSSSDNSTGNANAAQVVRIGIFSANGSTTFQATLGDHLQLAVRLNVTNVYFAMLPERCYFSNDETGANAIPFIENKCPHKDGFGIVNSWMYNSDGTEYIANWTAFKYDNNAGAGLLYIHCVVRVCSVNLSYCDVPKCEIPWNLTNSSNYLMQKQSGSGYARLLAPNGQLTGKANTVSTGIQINSPRVDYTTWYIIIGVLGALLCMVVLTTAIFLGLGRYRKKNVKDANRVQYVIPLRIPRAQIDYTTIS